MDLPAKLKFEFQHVHMDSSIIVFDRNFVHHFGETFAQPNVTLAFFRKNGADIEAMKAVTAQARTFAGTLDINITYSSGLAACSID